MWSLRECCLKILGVVIVIASLSIFGIQSITCLMKFLGQNTATTLHILSTNNAPFPQVTICPDYSIAYKKEILDYFNTTPHALRGHIYPKSTLLTSYEFHDFVTYDFTDLLVEMEVSMSHVFQWKNNNYYKMKYSSSHKIKSTKDTISIPFNTSDWIEERYNTLGRCFGYRAPEFLVDAQIRSIDFIFKKDTIVYFHHVGQFFNVDTNSKILTLLGQQLFIDTVHEILIDYPKKMSREEMVKERSKFDVTCDHALNEKLDYCLISGLDQRALKSIGCTFPTLTFLKSQACDAETMNETQAGLLRDFKIFWAQTSIDDCALPCSTMNVALGFPKYDNVYNRLRSRAKVYFKKRVTEKRNVVPYDWVTLLAEVGGYMGLLLGWSLLDLKKILNGAKTHFLSKNSLEFDT